MSIYQKGRGPRAAMRITHQGRTMTVREWAAELGCHTKTLRRLHDQGLFGVEAIPDHLDDIVHDLLRSYLEGKLSVGGDL